MRVIMAPLIVLVFLLANTRLQIHSAPATTYDQQQTGELNFQLHLKDIQIVALLDSGLLGDYAGDYDYAYDYTDFTIKPSTSSATTTSPSTLATSIKPWHTWPTIAPSATVTEATASKVPENPSEEEHISTDVSVSESPKPVEQPAEAADEDKDKDKDSHQQAETASESSSDESIKDPESSAVATKGSAATSDPELVPLLELAHPTSEKKMSSGTIKEKIVANKELTPAEQVPDSLIKTSLSAQVDSPSASTPESSADTTVQPENGEASTEQSQKIQKRCSPGQTRDQKGRCRLHIRRRVASSLLPFGIRLAPKLHRRRDLHIPSVRSDDEY